MDCEKLICEVRERKPLWDMRDSRYHARDVQRKFWKEVSEKMDSEVGDVKKKWRGLRDVFRREYRKIKKHKSGEEAESESYSTWAYFNMMLFLSDTIGPRELQGNVSPEPNPTQTVDSPQQDDINEILHDSSKPEEISTQSRRKSTATTSTTHNDNLISTPGPNFGYQKRKKQEKSSADEQFLEIERSKLELLAEGNNMRSDSDYQFLISLLPFLKKVRDHRKMIIRNKLQQVFIDEDEFHHQAARTPFTFTSTSSPSTYVQSPPASLIISDGSSQQYKMVNYPNYTQEQVSFAFSPAQNINTETTPTTETDVSFVIIKD